jgi:N-sulfoglucosamine sulfohydrolase
MNVIYMHTHDTGRFIQPYGNQIPTPSLMGLAEKGVLFRHAYCAAPTCSPSRSALLTGMAPHSAGMIGLAHRGFQLNDYSRHLVQHLGRNGYETALCGIQHEAPKPEMIGYDRIMKDTDFDMGNFEVDAASRDMKNAYLSSEYIKQHKDKPFFLSFGMFNTHRDFPEIDEDINPNYVVPPFPFYDNAKNREDMAAYITSARIVDRCVEMVLNALTESGQEDNTLIIFTTDHGIAFPKMKCNLYDTGIGVSLIMAFPGNPCKGEALDSLVSQIDLYPTICDLLHIDKPSWLQGKSLMPLLEKRAEKIRDEIFAEVTYHAAYEPMRCIRTERYKLIRLFDDHDQFVPANIDDCLSKDFLLEHGFLEGVRDKEMLFDLYMDPVERVNVAGDVRYKDIYRDLSGRLEKWMQETNDPLLDGGKVPKPEGAVANKLSCISPKVNDFE